MVRNYLKRTEPIMYSKYPSAENLQFSLNSPIKRTNSSLELVLPLVSAILSFTLGLGVAGITLLGVSSSRVSAQMPVGASTTSEQKVLFVNPNMGNNTAGNGSESAPLQTITQALQLASANTVIMLSPGTYSADTGEVFPLRLKPGVTIQGDISNKGQGITITGGGGFLSSSFGGQNVTIIGADEAKLTGVTVTNPNPRGYGLWIESSHPVISNNTFTGSTQDGISLTGNSTPTISQNHFHRNGANGITIGGDSQPEVRENIFDQTGFGINITQNAAPILVSNQIQNNRSGIIVQANARPILRNNLIQGNREDGLVAIAQAIPNLGTIAEPGGNQFRNNSRHDINASATKETIPAAGNNLSQNRIAGKVDINAQIAPTANLPQRRIVGNGSIQENNQSNQSQINYVRIDPNVVEFAAPQLPSSGQAAPPFGESPRSPVPNNNAYLPPARVPSGVRYRVVVNIANDRERAIVRNLAPDAFPTTRQGRRVMQVGVFSDRNNADEMVNALNRNGLRTTLEPLR